MNLGYFLNPRDGLLYKPLAFGTFARRKKAIQAVPSSSLNGCHQKGGSVYGMDG
jgi:hypothetical protein